MSRAKPATPAPSTGRPRPRASQPRTPAGITRVDFLPPYVIDGGEPILRFGARIYDLGDVGLSIQVIGTPQRVTALKADPARLGPPLGDAVARARSAPDGRVQCGSGR
jgi:hypothetical protein